MILIDTLRILVVEDSPEEIDGAKLLLSGHQLTVVSGFDQALELLEFKYDDKERKPKFDVVLTDVMLPKGGGRCMGPAGMELVRNQGAMPYGPIIALHALQHGVTKVGIITAGDHHSDPFVFAFDSLQGFTAGDIKVVCTNRMDCCLDTVAKQKIDRPDYNDRPAYDEFKRRQELGEIVWAKDWSKLLTELQG